MLTRGDCISYMPSLSAENVALRHLSLEQVGLFHAAGGHAGALLVGEHDDGVVGSDSGERAAAEEEGVRVASPLESLSLRYSSINDKGAMHVLRALEGNRRLVELHLGGNHVNDESLVMRIKSLLRRNARSAEL